MAPNPSVPAQSKLDSGAGEAVRGEGNSKSILHELPSLGVCSQADSLAVCAEIRLHVKTLPKRCLRPLLSAEWKQDSGLPVTDLPPPTAVRFAASESLFAVNFNSPGAAPG